MICTNVLHTIFLDKRRKWGFLKSCCPDTIPLTEEQFQTFLEETVLTEHSRRILDALTAQNAATALAQGAETAARGTFLPTAKAAHTAQESGADGNKDEGAA